MIGIVTINDYTNFGNRLQNYAVFKILSKYDDVYNLKKFYGNEYPDGLNSDEINYNYDTVLRFKEKMAFYGCSRNSYQGIIKFNDFEKQRRDNFLKFNQLIKQGEFLGYDTDFESLNNKYDFFITGSDQVFNDLIPGNTLYYNMLAFVPKEKRIALAPSIAISDLSETQINEFKKYLSDYQFLSCREKEGAKLIESITNKKCEALIDPVFILDVEEWEKIEIKPEFHNENKKYLLLYFLGTITNDYQKIIDDISKENNLEVINLLDQNSLYYTSGPSEFLYLIHHCELMLTDSFHGSSFSYIFNKPFRIFKRIDSLMNMNSRLENLIDILHLSKDIYIDQNTNITNIFNTEYDRVYYINEKNKFLSYLERALNKK